MLSWFLIANGLDFENVPYAMVIKTIIMKHVFDMQHITYIRTIITGNDDARQGNKNKS